jgi:hypothetical protein
MNNQPERYTAYLLRIWQVNRDGEWDFRISLENIHTGERRGFASVEALIAFLLASREEDREASGPFSER